MIKERRDNPNLEGEGRPKEKEKKYEEGGDRRWCCTEDNKKRRRKHCQMTFFLSNFDVKPYRFKEKRKLFQ